jgi:hypothetical protein
MRKASLVAAVVAVVAFAPVKASAWGTTAHRLIMARAIDILPADLRPLFVEHRDELVLRVIDPDLWRNIGWEDDPNHFINFGVKEFGEYPFRELPHEYGAALEKFGIATLRRDGTVPWRFAEEFGNVRRAFEGFARNSPFAVNDVVLYSAIAAHYIQDATQPLHASNNYDGQLTGNIGIHARFESALVERFQSRLTLSPGPVVGIKNARESAFDACLSGYKLVDAILKADNEAKAGKDVYDDDYFEKLFTRVKPMLEQRLSESITSTANMIVGAWEQAGKPQPTLANAPRPPQKIK